jgi:hypothetical protein
MMRFGIFGAAQAGSPRPGGPMGQGFHDFIDFNVEAEAFVRWRNKPSGCHAIRVIFLDLCRLKFR